jgi:threonine dehydrogenase-like Zn-dependent dehydrogenase
LSASGINVGSKHDFEDMNALIAASNIRFEDIIDKTFGFAQAGEAIEYLWSGKHVGKVVIDLDV